MRVGILAMGIFWGMAYGQTTLDLRTQSKDVDFSGAISTRPLQTGTVLPPTCNVGQMFFLSNGPSGSNVYGCTAVNTWTLEGGSGAGGGGGGASAANQLTDVSCGRVSNTVVSCSFPGGGTNFGNGNFVSNFAGACSITLAGGSAAAGSVFYFYWDPAGNALKVDMNASVTAANVITSGCAKANTGASGYPADVKPLWRFTAGNSVTDQWDPAPLNDDRSAFTTSITIAGTGLTSSVDAHGRKTLNVDPTQGIFFRTCVIDNDTQSATALVAAQFSGGCEIPAAGTILEIDVWGGTGTVAGTLTTTGSSSVNLQRFTPLSGATATVLSGSLATASGYACALPSTSGTCLTGTASSGSVAISTTSLSAGDWIRVSSATPDATQTWYRIAIIYAL